MKLAITALCQALQQDTDINIRFESADALVLIINPKSVKFMSENPKYQNNFNAPISNFNQGDVKIAGDQVGIQHNYAPENKQSLAEAAKEIQDLLVQLQQTNPAITEQEKQTIIIPKVQQQIKQNPTLRDRLWNALASGSIEALKQALDAIYKNPLISISVETIKGFLEAESRD